MVKPEDQPAHITAHDNMAGGLGVLPATKKVRKEIAAAVLTSSSDGAHKAEMVVFPASMESLTMVGIPADQCPTKLSLGRKSYQCSH